VIAPTEQSFPAPAASTSLVVVAEPVPAAEPAKTDGNAATATFKPGKGLDVKSADGNFSLNTRLRFQVLNELHAPAAKAQKTRDYTVLRRIRLTFGGNVFSKDIKYKLDLGVGVPEMGSEPSGVVNKGDRTKPPADGSGAPVTLSTDRDVLSQGPIEDAYLDFTQIRDLNLHVGQGKVPFGLERLYSDGELQSVDRSVVSAEFNFDRDIGFDIRSQDLFGIDKVRYYLGIYSGEGRNATVKSVGGGDLGFVYVGRVELFPLGTYDAYSGPDVELAKDPKLELGLAYAFSQMDATSLAAKQDLGSVYGAPGDTALVDYNAHHFTADAQFRMQGFSAMTQLQYRKVTTIKPARTGLGWTLQAGYLLSEDHPLEIAGQFAMTRPTGAKADSVLNKYNEAGGGLNYYFYGHGLKLQAEYAHTWEQGVKGTDDNRVRVQLQAAL
jgi:hypothetical protein